MTKSTREDKQEACSSSFDEDIRFFFQELPRIFRAKHETAMNELEKAIAELKPKIRKERLAHEKAHREAFGQFLSTLEEHLKAWVNGTGPQDSRRFGALADETCRQLSEANQEALRKDSDFRRVEELLDGTLEAIGKQFAKKEAAFAADVYRQVALQLREKHSKNQAFRQKPYEVKLHDGEIVEPPVSLARDDGAWIGDNWIGAQPTATEEMFPPPEDVMFPVGIVHPYQTPGWLTYGPKGISAKKASSVLSNILFQRLLSGLPNIKVAVFDSGRSDIKDYEHDLSRDLPADPETHEKLLATFLDFEEFNSCMGEWLRQQPGDFKRMRNNKSANKRLFQLYAILILPDDPTEYECESYRRWMTTWVRQASKGVGLFVVSTDNVYKIIGGENAGFAHLTLDNAGQSLALGEGGKLWEVKKTTWNPSWATNDEDWNMGSQVLKKLICPPQKELPGTISVHFANEENGEWFNLRYSSQCANTIFIYGRQGSGKSVALMSFILRAAKKYSPEELTFYIFDFKNTFYPFETLKHVACLTLNTNQQIMLGVLKDIEAQREERQRKFSEIAKKYRVTCDNLDSYNQFRQDHPEACLPVLPRMLVVVDECKDMLFSSLPEIDKEEGFFRAHLLSQGRAAGIHFLFATTEDIRGGTVGRTKFDAMLELSKPRDGRFIATLTEGEDHSRTLVMPTISHVNLFQDIDGINHLHEGAKGPLAPLYFASNQESSVPVADYVPFTVQIQNLAKPEKDTFLCSAGIDTQNLRQLHTITFKQGKSGQGLSIFGRWDSPSFQGGMELFLRTLELAARRGDISVDVLDPETRWAGKTDGCDGRFNVWTDDQKFLAIKRGWLRTAAGADDGSRVLVAFDAEYTLQGEEMSAQQALTKKSQRREKPSVAPDADADGPSPADLAAAIAEESHDMPDVSEELSPEEVDRHFQNARFLQSASARSAFLVAVTEQPIALRDSMGLPDGYGRFLVFSTARQLSDLDNSEAENMGYFTDSPGAPRQYFLPFAVDGIAKAVLKAAKPQKGADKT